eukprot:10259242-Prorocentrum_lima.AAC.1
MGGHYIAFVPCGESIVEHNDAKTQVLSRIPESRWSRPVLCIYAKHSNSAAPDMQATRNIADGGAAASTAP